MFSLNLSVIFCCPRSFSFVVDLMPATSVTKYSYSLDFQHPSAPCFKCKMQISIQRQVQFSSVQSKRWVLSLSFITVKQPSLSSQNWEKSGKLPNVVPEFPLSSMNFMLLLHLWKPVAVVFSQCIVVLFSQCIVVLFSIILWKEEFLVFMFEREREKERQRQTETDWTSKVKNYRKYSAQETQGMSSSYTSFPTQ